jgi:cytoskeleton protein RodZ
LTRLLLRKYHQVGEQSELREGVAMGTFGENLRREREMRGVSLEEISDATKISVRALQAMENDQFEKLPGGIFTRSFIRTYAKYLGLDDEKIMAEFQLVAPPSAQQTDLRRMSQQRTPLLEEKSHAGLLAVAVLALMAAGGFAYYRYAKRAPAASPTSVQPPSSTSSQPQTAASNPSDAAGTGTQSAPVAGVPAIGTTAAPAGAPEDGLLLQIAATEETWVAVSADGKSSSQLTMVPNEIETYRANKSFDVLTGNAQGIILTLNGKTLDPLGRRGETKKVHLTLNDIQNPNP